MIRASKIVVTRAEGPTRECGQPVDCHLPDPWAAARRQLLAWARTAPEHGGYDKVDFSVFYEDGEVYEGRCDITRDGEDTDVARHMRDFLECYALRRIPLAYAGKPDLEARFRRHVLDECADTHRKAVAFLDSYQIGAT